MAVRRPFEHGVMAHPNHDEAAREQAWLSLKLFMTDEVYPGDELVYEKMGRPAFDCAHGRPPQAQAHEAIKEPHRRHRGSSTWCYSTAPCSATLWAR